MAGIVAVADTWVDHRTVAAYHIAAEDMLEAGTLVHSLLDSLAADTRLVDHTGLAVVHLLEKTNWLIKV